MNNFENVIYNGNGKFIRAHDEFHMALAIVAKKNDRSIPRQLFKFLRENKEIKKIFNKGIVPEPPSKVLDRKCNSTRIQICLINKLAVIAEKNDRTISNQVIKYIKDGIKRDEKN